MLVGVTQETRPIDELRVIVGNTIAIRAYRADTLSFPDGVILVKLAWQHGQSSEFASAFVPRSARTVQMMVKDTQRYAETGGWGFGRFVDGKPVDGAQHRTCFACHAARVKAHDFVYTRYAQ